MQGNNKLQYLNNHKSDFIQVFTISFNTHYVYIWLLTKFARILLLLTKNKLFKF